MADDIRVLLVCGTGASSGFMAANMRKAVAAHGYNIKVTARRKALCAGSQTMVWRRRADMNPG